MGELRCVDGSVLSVEPVSCHDRAGRPYEITLSLSRNSAPFAAVGQRCGYQLAQLAERVSAARHDPAQAAAWPDPDDRFPAPGIGDGSGAGVGAGAGRGRPEGAPGGAVRAAGDESGDHEFFALRSRDRVDPPGTGELRCVLRSSAIWLGECAAIGQHAPPRQRAGQRLPARAPASDAGSWRLTRRAVIEAWGAGGVGVRAVLTSAELMAFLDTVLTGLVAVAASDAGSARQESASDLPAGQEPGGTAMPRWQQQGRVPDAIPQSRLPAVRAQARGGTVASGDSPARGGHVRR
jgi:hypothetical protein